MSDSVNGLIESQIDARLKKIMEQRNIHNEAEINPNVDKPAEDRDEGEVLFKKRSPRSNKIHPLNQIIYGAPGTGKTYSTVEYAVAIIENRKVEQRQYTEAERKELISKYENYMSKGQITFTTFHQSYGYEEFIQGIRPIPEGKDISFRLVDGVFKKIANVAIDDDKNNYVIVIDEINRGNISKIFGELITLIEEDKRWGEINQMSVTLPMGESFAIPNNLYIIGTMNSADKSISLIDAALRRRFEFVEKNPDADTIKDEKLRDILLKLNAYLRREQRSSDLLIGHSYFIGKTLVDIEPIMNRSLIPLLYEYFYDDEAKVKKALECISDTGYVIDENATGRLKIKKEG